MDIHSLIIVLCIHAAALISPGPDFAVITRISVVSGRSSGITAALGVASAIGIYVTLGSLGISVLLLAMPVVSHFLTYAGTLYLLYLGVQSLRSKGEMPEKRVDDKKGRAFITGFCTNLLNPKAMIYVSSILSQVLKPHAPLLETGGIVVLLFLESFAWFSFVAFIFSSEKVLLWLKGRLIWFERGIGVILIALAIKLASLA